MSRAPAPPVHALSLECPFCGKTSQHRVLHVQAYREGVTMEGVARCSLCRASHPFQILTKETKVRVILSEGAQSKRIALPFPPDRRLKRGDTLGLEGRKYLVSKIETQGTPSAKEALAKEIRALWAVPGDRVTLKISVTTGSETTPVSLRVRPEKPVHVGDRLVVDGNLLFISALRMGGRTLRERGMGGEAGEVQRAYAHPVRGLERVKRLRS